MITISKQKIKNKEGAEYAFHMVPSEYGVNSEKKIIKASLHSWIDNTIENNLLNDVLRNPMVSNFVIADADLKNPEKTISAYVKEHLNEIINGTPGVSML